LNISIEYVLEELVIEDVVMLATVLAVTGDAAELEPTCWKQRPEMELANGGIICTTNASSAQYQ
jgi:hypothetical protein